MKKLILKFNIIHNYKILSQLEHQRTKQHRN